MLLTLPLLASDIPAAIDFTPVGEHHLRLVLAMSRQGMIFDGDLAGLRRTDVNALTIRSLIERGWQREIGGEYDFKLISAYARLILPHPNDPVEFLSEDGQCLVGVAINAAHPEWIAIGKAFSAIEALQPGLGRKALCILENSLWRFGVPHTAGGAFDMARNLYWEGGNDESMVLQEYGDPDTPHRAELFRDIPEWAYVDFSSAYPMASDEEFAAAAVRLDDQPIGQLLAALLRLKRLDSDKALCVTSYQDEDYLVLNEPPIVCGWNQENDLDRVFDDNYRYLAEGGEDAPWAGCVKFPPSVQGITESLPRVHHTGRVLRALDAALVETRKLNNEL
jgi:hypothetical protein